MKCDFQCSGSAPVAQSSNSRSHGAGLCHRMFLKGNYLNNIWCKELKALRRSKGIICRWISALNTSEQPPHTVLWYNNIVSKCCMWWYIQYFDTKILYQNAVFGDCSPVSEWYRGLISTRGLTFALCGARAHTLRPIGPEGCYQPKWRVNNTRQLMLRTFLYLFILILKSFKVPRAKYEAKRFQKFGEHLFYLISAVYGGWNNMCFIIFL